MTMTYAQLLTWQLRASSTLDPEVCAQAWAQAKRAGDLDLQVLALSRDECPEGVIEEAVRRKEAVIRIALLSRRSLPAERVEALLAGETRANVLVGVLEARAHRSIVSARARALFAEKPTIALANALVGESEIDAETRVSAAVLLAPRFEQHSDAMQRVLVNLPGQIASSVALERLVAQVDKPCMLDAVAGAKRVGAAAQERIMDICVVKRLEAARSTYSWAKTQAQRRAEQVLAQLLEHPVRSERLGELAAPVLSELSASGKALLGKLSEEEPVEEPERSYEERIAALGGRRDWSEASSLITDLQCPSSLLVRIADVIAACVGSVPEVAVGLKQRAGDDELLRAVACAAPAAFIQRLGWELFADREGARREVLGALDGRNLRNLSSEEGFIDTETVSMCSWSAIQEYAMYPARGCAVASALGALQRQALGTDASRWEVFGSLAEGFEGTVAELLTACANVLGEDLELDLRNVEPIEPASS